jgi:hypothetical protein
VVYELFPVLVFVIFTFTGENGLVTAQRISKKKMGGGGGGGGGEGVVWGGWGVILL